MGIGMGTAIAAAVETGQPVVAVEGDSAFGFSGMEVETICRYNLPVCVVIFNNSGIYRGTDTDPTGRDPGTTVFVRDAKYQLMMEAFGGVGRRGPLARRPRARRARGHRVRQADAGQRDHRPGGGHRERPHRQPEPAERGQEKEVSAAFARPAGQISRGRDESTRRRQDPGFHACAVGADLHAAAGLAGRRRHQGRAAGRGRRDAQAAGRRAGGGQPLFHHAEPQQALDRARHQEPGRARRS